MDTSFHGRVARESMPYFLNSKAASNSITHDFPETFACFSGLLPLPSVCVCSSYDFVGNFDTKALDILRASPYVEPITEEAFDDAPDHCEGF